MVALVAFSLTAINATRASGAVAASWEPSRIRALSRLGRIRAGSSMTVLVGVSNAVPAADDSLVGGRCAPWNAVVSYRYLSHTLGGKLGLVPKPHRTARVAK